MTGIRHKRPEPGTLPEWGFEWYANLTFGRNTSINPFFYGTYLAPTLSSELDECVVVVVVSEIGDNSKLLNGNSRAII